MISNGASQQVEGQALSELAPQFLLYEVYDDEAALEAPWEKPHFRRIIEETVVPLLERRERHLYPLVEP